MSPNNRAVNHALFHIRIIGKVGQHPFSHALLALPAKPFVDRVPFALLGRQEPPWGTAAGQPEDTFHKPATFCSILADVSVRVVSQKISYLCPLAIPQSHSCHETSLPLYLNVNTT